MTVSIYIFNVHPSSLDRSRTGATYLQVDGREKHRLPRTTSHHAPSPPGPFQSQSPSTSSCLQERRGLSPQSARWEGSRGPKHLGPSSYEFFIITFIEVALVGIIIQISGAQCNSKSVHLIVCSPSQVSFPSVTPYLTPVFLNCLADTLTDSHPCPVPEALGERRTLERPPQTNSVTLHLRRWVLCASPFLRGLDHAPNFLFLHAK